MKCEIILPPRALICPLCEAEGKPRYLCMVDDSETLALHLRLFHGLGYPDKVLELAS